jgi:TetR/AcrR family transcriptional regulator, transcriptional repressor for nem operon
MYAIRKDWNCMRKSKQEAAVTRQRIIKAAAAAFRKNGIAGTGLSDLMAAAGLTHGGFYRHFDSKDQIVAEACTAAAGSGVQVMLASKCASATYWIISCFCGTF